MSELKTAKDILIEAYNTFLDKKVRIEFDERLEAETPEEEKEIDAEIEKVVKELESLEMMQRMGKPVRAAHLEKRKAEKIVLEKKFVKLRYPRLLALARKMMEEEK